MIVDVWSRNVIAATVFDQESMDLAASLFTQAWILVAWPECI